MHSSAIRGCHEEGSGGGTPFRDFLKLPGHTKSIPWPEIRAAAAERALDMQAWRDAIKNLAPLAFKKPHQAGRMTRSCACRGGSPGLVHGALANDCDLAEEDMEVVASGTASVKSKGSKECVCVSKPSIHMPHVFFRIYGPAQSCTFKWTCTKNGRVPHIHRAPAVVRLQTWTWTEVQVNRPKVLTASAAQTSTGLR
eukprot:365178-Chlamydomonas_euryale.AAC.4